jgi:hypothetical protein
MSDSKAYRGLMMTPSERLAAEEVDHLGFWTAMEIL